MELGSGTTILIGAVLVACAIAALIKLGERGSDKRLRTKRATFTREVGGTEHTGTGTTRPSFGHFDSVDHYTPPFHWAIEFNRAGHQVVVHESRTVRFSPSSTKPSRSHELVSQTRHVQLPAPRMPYIRIVPKKFIPGTVLGSIKEPLVSGTPADAQGLLVFCHDESFARGFVTPALAAAVATPRHTRAHSLSVTFTEGTVYASIGTGKRLRPDEILRTADCLIDVLNTIPRQAWTSTDQQT